MGISYPAKGTNFAPKNSPYVTFGSSGDLTNEKVITAGSGINIDASSASAVVISTARQKVAYTITGSHTSGNNLTVPGINFSGGSYSDANIDIFINGVLMASGSNEDYTLAGDTQNVVVNFNLGIDDKITVVIQ